MSKIKNVPKVIDARVQDIRSAMEHRAIWFALIAREAQEAGAPWEEIMRKAISKCGCFHGKEMLEGCAARGDTEGFASIFMEEKDLFEMETVNQGESKFSVFFHYCPLVAGWQALGCSDEEIITLCDIAMDGDRSIASTCGFKFTLGSTIAKGMDMCELTFSKK